jgi:outer membrane lipoprotein SlyB
MKTQKLVSGLFALALLLPLTFAPGGVHAQQGARAAAAPRIDGFDVQPVAKPVAGSALAFTLYGSAGGTASVRVGGATGDLILREVEAGVYEGTYTIAQRDRINSASTATANLRMGNQVASSVLDESLIAGAAARWPGGATGSNGVPKIDRFDVDAPASLTPGGELAFVLTGSPGGSASVRIAGVRGKTALEETSSGVYEGAYRVRNRDRIEANTVVTGNLRLGTMERTKVLGQSLVENSPSPNRQRSGRRAAAQAAQAAPVCATCGRVEAVNVVETKGDGSYIGMIAGGIAGVVLGSQVGHGQGTTIAQVLGGAGGAYAGNEVEKRMKTTKHFEVVVRLDNGGSQMISYPAEPAFKVGTRVRVDGGTLVQL